MTDEMIWANDWRGRIASISQPTVAMLPATEKRVSKDMPDCTRQPGTGSREPGMNFFRLPVPGSRLLHRVRVRPALRRRRRAVEDRVEQELERAVRLRAEGDL